MRTGCAFATFGAVSSSTPFFSVAVTLPASTSHGKSTILRIWSARLSTQTVFPFFSSFEDSRCPVIVRQPCSTATSISFSVKPGTSAFTVNASSVSVMFKATGCRGSRSACSQLSKSRPKIRPFELKISYAPAGQGIERLLYLGE